MDFTLRYSGCCSRHQGIFYCDEEIGKIKCRDDFYSSCDCTNEELVIFTKSELERMLPKPINFVLIIFCFILVFIAGMLFHKFIIAPKTLSRSEIANLLKGKNSLTPQQLKLMKYLYINGETKKYVAQMMDMHRNTVRTIELDALKVLRSDKLAK